MEMEETAGGLKMMVGRITNLGFSQAWQGGGKGNPMILTLLEISRDR